MKIVFAGTPDFAATSLAALLASEHEVCAVYTQPDRPAGRGRKLTASPVKQLALEHDLPVMQPVTLKDEDQQAILRDWQCDVMVVVAYGLILPPAVLAIPSLACINVHASLLPRWRGAAPIQRAIAAGDEETGVTIMEMAEGLDTGDMLLKGVCPISKQDTGGMLHDRLATLGADLLIEALQGLAQGQLTAEPQDDALSCYAAKLKKSEAEIDWQLPADQLDRLVRAFNPWPVTFTLMPDGQRLRVWAAEACDNDSDVEPGTVLQADHEGLYVACGEGSLRLLTVQIPGGRAVSSQDFLNAHSLTDGIVLGRA